MKTIENIIAESKIENLMVPEYDVRPYLNFIFDRWLQDVRGYSVISLSDNYTKIQLCRQCELIIYILDKFSGDLQLYFSEADDTVKRGKDYAPYTIEDSILNIFEIVCKAMEIKSINPTQGLKDGESITDEVDHLKKNFYALVEKCNKKYHEKQKQNNTVNKTIVPVPCEIGCCDCC